MNCRIERVIVFTKNKDKNEVPFNSGLNIISGVSQTGKSAIIEIADYCLASTTSSIPKGVIVDNSILYSIVLDIGKNYIILARRPYYYDNKDQIGKSKMFFNVESKKNFVCDNINYNYFKKSIYSFRPLDDVKKELEKFLNISVYKQTVYEDNEVKTERVSIRNMVSFLFQHQNLVANKFALFYRFDDSMKRKKTIMQFPIFLGLVDQKYYELLQLKESNQKRLRKLEKEKKLDKEFNEKISARIKNDIKEYYRLIGKEIEDIEIDNILSNKKSIDRLSIEDINIEKSLIYYNELKENFKNINSKIYILENEKQNINITLNSGNSVEKIIKEINKNEDDINKNKILRCPFCNSEVISLNAKMERIEQCKTVLNDSLSSISFIKKEYLEEEKYKLNMKIRDYKEKQNNLRNDIKELKSRNKKIQENIDFKDLIIEKRIRIEEDLNRIGLSQSNKDKEITNLKDSTKELKEKLEGYDLGKELNGIEYIINEFMNKMASKLDFESRYTPINLKFDSRNFDLYQYQKKDKEKIFLSSMGSGSNWLTCHLSLFVALHYCFAKLGEKCSIPSILILDQPSQIYFPNINDKEDKDIDIISVEKIYSALEWAIDYIEQKTGKKIQIIVLDHASGLKFKNKKFDDFIVKRWNEKGNGLIKIKNTGIY